MKISLVLGVVLCCVAVRAQLPAMSAVFNGTAITGPMLIYHDEIDSDNTAVPTDENSNGPGDLVCRSESIGRTFWRRPHGGSASMNVEDSFYQVRSPTNTDTHPFLSQLSTIDTLDSTDPEFNGLWLCTFGSIDSFIYVGIYSRNSGLGVINTSSISLVDPFMADPPSFTLIGDTTGGPPETSTWTRNDVTISDDVSYSISLTVPGVTDSGTPFLTTNSLIFQESRYRSTLTVTGNLPGVYVYSVINRAMSEPRTANITIEGGDITNLAANQTGLTTVQVTWTAPPGPPAGGYQITVAEASISNVNDQESPYTFTTSELGVHTVQVTPSSQHFPGQAVSVMVTVEGAGEASVTTSSLNATSVTISWSPQPAQFRLPVVEYTVSLTRVTGSGQVICTGVTHSIPAVTTTDTSMSITDLEEFSTYTVTVTTTFNVFGSNMDVESEMTFTTPSAAPTGAPRGVMTSMTSRSIMVTWGTIDCIERNGVITGYTVVFQEQGGANVTSSTSTELQDRMFSATELTPFTNYIFRVAGVNDDGTGVFAVLTITTDEEAPGPVSDLTASAEVTSVVITWSVPQEPNGIIISYEVMYSIDGVITVANTNGGTTTLTIPTLPPNTVVSSILVSAFTSIGQGESLSYDGDVVIPEVPTLSMVTGVMVEQLTATSVRVSWDEIPVDMIMYTVYYSQTGNRKRQSTEMSMDSTTNSLDIDDLDNVVYQFQVVAFVIFNGMRIESTERSEVNSESIVDVTEGTVTGVTEAPTNDGGSTGSSSSVVGPVVGGVIVAIAVVVAVVLMILFLLWLRKNRRSNSKKIKSNADTVRYTRAGQAPLLNMQQNTEPVIDEFPDDTHAIEGEGVVFKVTVVGKPEPKLTWFRDDTQVTNTYGQEVLDDGSLNFPSVELKQAGVYRLVATNSVGKAEQQVKLSVQCDLEKTPEVDRKAVEAFTPIPVPEFGVYVVKNHDSNNQGFRDQFQGLESGDGYAKDIGLSADFKKLNRFANITNYNHSRITLQPMPQHPDCEREFINGCYISGYSAEKKFIATQGPIPRTVVDFWRLVWQEKPPTIVMVTNLKEGNKKKCEQYWPDSGSTTYGPFKVTLTENQVFADYCIRTMQVTLDGRPHKLKQFHFTAWPDHGVPDYATPMLAFHRRIISSHNPKRGPILVHCSAGVGRTGTFICIDNVLDQIKRENVVDIAGSINKMRHQRMKMVQTPEQYVFLHDAMLESVTCGDTQISASDLRMRIKRYEKVDPTTGVTTFQSQFEVLEQVSPKPSEVICKSATENPERNRRNVYLPSDRFRVLLKGEHPDYINAVFAHGYKHQKSYIIAEGPMASTTRNMLKILYDRKVGAVVMLSATMENGEESSTKYWPSQGKLETFGEYTVDLISEEPLEGFTIRILSILEQKTQKAHQVTQLHITCWAPDGQCSNLRSVVDSIDEMAKVQRRTGNKPIFVHCSDTVTRSGMFCAMATVIDRCKTEGMVDVFQVVKALRVQKPGAVPTMECYKTIFDATLTFLDSFDTYANFQNV